jgi:hypothetical protein
MLLKQENFGVFVIKETEYKTQRKAIENLNEYSVKIKNPGSDLRDL